MQVVGLLSGGKDSCFNLLHCLANGHEVVAVAHLAPPAGQDELDSYMYQTVGHEAVALIAQCLELPLFTETIKGSSVARDRDYVPTAPDEVEDLARLLERVKAAHPGVQAVAVGAILSDYQRTRVEHVCRRLGLTALAYLWQQDQQELVESMLACEMEPVLVKVAAYGLDPKRHLGQPLRTVLPLLVRLHADYDVHVAGEGGEYETLTLDCPLFRHKRIVVEDAQHIAHSNDGLVGYLQLTRLALADKPPSQILSAEDVQPRTGGSGLRLCRPGANGPLGRLCRSVPALLAPFESAWDAGRAVPSVGNVEPSNAVATPTPVPAPERVHTVGPWIVVANVCVPGSTVAASTTAALERLQGLLDGCGVTLAHVVALTAVVASMADYAEVNRAYATFFGLNPPARVAVAVAGGPDVVFHVVAHRVMTDPVRKTLHVQSISNWAPANIAPYSQAVAAGSALWIAGQIPLVPGTMELALPAGRTTWELTARHAWTVLARMGPAHGRLLLGTAWLATSTLASYRPWWAAVWSAIASAEPLPLLVVAQCDALPRSADVEVAWLAARYDREPPPDNVGDDDHAPIAAADAARLWPQEINHNAPRPGVSIQTLARRGSALWAALAECTIDATDADLANVHADMAAAAARASVALVQAVVYTAHPLASSFAIGAVPVSIVPVRSLESGLRLVWTCWGVRAPTAPSAL